MQERYEIASIEQLRAIADVLRTRIMELLRERPMTVTQIAEILSLAPARVHYHVRELEKVGLVRLVETREKGGILEKYYQPIARNIVVAADLLLAAPTDEVMDSITAWFEQVRGGFQDALRQELQREDQLHTVSLSGSQLYMTGEEMQQFFKNILAVMKPYEKRRGIDGEREIVSTFVMYALTGEQKLEPPAIPLFSSDEIAEKEKGI